MIMMMMMMRMMVTTIMTITTTKTTSTKTIMTKELWSEHDIHVTKVFRHLFAISGRSHMMSATKGWRGGQPISDIF